MADIVNQAKTQVTVDGQQAASELTALEKKARKFKDQMIAANNAGDTKAYNKAQKGLKEVDKEMRNVLRSSYDVNKVLNNLSTAGPKQLKAALSALNKELNSGKVARGSKEWNQLQDKIRLVRKEIEKINSEQGITKSKNLIGSVQVMLGNIYTKALSLLGSALYDAVNKIRLFEKANVTLASILGVNKKDVKDLSDSAISLSKNSQFAASQVTELQTELAKLGFTKGEIKDVQAHVLNFATALEASLPDAAALAGSSLRAFGANSSESQRYMDAMTDAANKSAIGFEYLATAMPTVAPVAKAFNFSIEDTLALLGKLSDSGFDASTAATSLRNILLNLADSNGKLAKALGKPVTNLDELVAGLQRLKDKGIDLATALELTDQRSVAAFQTFLQGSDTLLELRDSLKAAGGEAERVAKDQMDNLDGSTKRLGASWSALMLAFSNSTGPMKKVVDGLTGIVNWVNKAVEASGRLQDSSLYKDFIGGKRKEATIEFEIKLRSGVEGQTYNLLKGDIKENFENIVKSNFSIQKELLQNEIKQLTKEQQAAQQQLIDAQNSPSINRTIWGVSTKDEKSAEKLLTSITSKADTAKARLDALNDAYNSILKSDKTIIPDTKKTIGGIDTGSNGNGITKERKEINDALIELETKYQEDMVEIKQSYLNGDILSEKAYNDKILEQQDKYDDARKKKLQELQKSISDPTVQLELAKQIADIEMKNLDKRIADKAKKQSQATKDEQDLLKWNEEETQKIIEASLGNISAVEDKDTIALLEKRRQNLITEEEYQKEITDIQIKHLKERLLLNGLSEDQIASIRIEMLEKEIKTMEDIEAERKRLLGQSDNFIVDLATRMAEINKGIEDGAISFAEGVRLKVAAVLGVMQTVAGEVSSYMQAAAEAETAAVKKKYDLQIKAAGNNSKQVKKLEEQRDKELAEVNKKNEERSFKIQIAMALASTAQSAINAYSSAAAIPVIGFTLAPIAAGVATAAGLLQVAAIKKQHEAAMANYWDGGYTGPGGKYDIAGYVHKGEFVVTQEALSNPEIRPYVDIIDTAQRNNTVSSLKSTDFSTAMEYREKVAFSPLGSNGIRSKEEQRQNEYLLSVLSQVVDTIAILDKRFSKGEVYVKNYVKGKYGMEEAFNLAGQMDKNVKR